MTKWSLSKFQSTLPHGSDVVNGRYKCSTVSNFNPRSLTGATYYNLPCVDYTTISIHAPSRERQQRNSHLMVVIKFQSTLPHGSDIGLINSKMLISSFQSTLPHGSDINSGLSLGKFSFQSTLPHGSDLAVKFDNLRFAISIHAPSRERLVLLPQQPGTLAISIHAPSRERRTGFTAMLIAFEFQSTLPHGSDLIALLAGISPLQFQSTLPHGSDLIT